MKERTSKLQTPMFKYSCLNVRQFHRHRSPIQIIHHKLDFNLSVLHVDESILTALSTCCHPQHLIRSNRPKLRLVFYVHMHRYLWYRCRTQRVFSIGLTTVWNIYYLQRAILPPSPIPPLYSPFAWLSDSRSFSLPPTLVPFHLPSPSVLFIISILSLPQSFMGPSSPCHKIRYEQPVLLLKRKMSLRKKRTFKPGLPNQKWAVQQCTTYYLNVFERMMCLSLHDLPRRKIPSPTFPIEGRASN